MDLGDNDDGGDIGGGFHEEIKKRLSGQKLPDDLPTSLDDRKAVPTHYTAETEMYDAWQGGKTRDVGEL